MTHQDEKSSVPTPAAGPGTLGQLHRRWATMLRQQRLQASPWQSFAASVAERYARPLAQGRTGEEKAGFDQEKTAAGPGEKAPDLTGDLASLEQSSPQSLDLRSREILAAILPFPLPAVQIYANSLADTIARQYRADALSWGNRILFRRHTLVPHRREGLALLGHEMTHVNQSSLPAPGDEVEALANEAKILQALESAPGAISTASFLDSMPPPGRPWGPARSVFSTPQPPASVQGPPRGPSESGAPAGLRAARSDRPLGTGTSGPPPAAALTEISEGQLRLIKEEVYRDIMQRIRTEFERGG